jgi:hypothetical protein
MHFEGQGAWFRNTFGDLVLVLPNCPGLAAPAPISTQPYAIGGLEQVLLLAVT